MNPLSLRSPLVWAASELSAPEVLELSIGRVAVFTRPCPETTPESNEDAAALVALDEETLVIAVADGAGGSPLGGTAARAAVEQMVQALLSAGSDPPPRELILRGFDRANSAVLELGVGAATTLAVAEIGPRAVRTYHTGDSAVLVTGQRGKLKLLTVAHSPVGYAQEAGLLDEEAALHHEHRNVVSNMIGTAAMRVEMGSLLELSERDTVVLGSDGLFDNLSVAEIAEHVRAGPIEAAAGALAEACQARMTRAAEGKPSKPDDLTFVLFRR